MENIILIATREVRSTSLFKYTPSVSYTHLDVYKRQQFVVSGGVKIEDEDEREDRIEKYEEIDG